MKVVSPAQEFLALQKDVNLLFSSSLYDMFLVSLKSIKAIEEILKIMFSSNKPFLPSIIKFHGPSSSNDTVMRKQRKSHSEYDSVVPKLEM